MARTLTNAQKTALSAKVKHVGVLVEIDYTPTPLRVWSGLGNIGWDSKTWLGVGKLGSISAIQEKTGARAGMVKLTLSGVPAEEIERALNDLSQAREVKIWVATFTVAGGVWSVIDAPNLIEWGETDVHEIIESDDTATIEVNVETAFARLTLLQVLRYTLADHQRIFPGDMFFEFAPQVANRVLYWPTPSPSDSARPIGNVGGVDVSQVL